MTDHLCGLCVTVFLLLFILLKGLKMAHIVTAEVVCRSMQEHMFTVNGDVDKISVTIITPRSQIGRNCSNTNNIGK